MKRMPSIQTSKLLGGAPIVAVSWLKEKLMSRTRFALKASVEPRPHVGPMKADHGIFTSVQSAGTSITVR